jgi:methionyl-tRNA synthetase
MRLAETHLDMPIENPGESVLEAAYTNALERFEFNVAMEYIWSRIQLLDQKISAEEPFKVVKIDPEKGKQMIREAVHEVYIIACYLRPLLPQTCDVIQEAVLSNKKPENLFPRK